MLRHRWAVLAVAAVAVTGAVSLGASQLASAGTQTNRKAATSGAAGGAADAPALTGTHYFTVAASAFAPDGLHTTTSDYFNLWDPSTLSNSDPARCFNAEVDLPNGAKLASVTFFYTAGSSTLFGELNRQQLSNHTAVVLASFSSITNRGTPFYTSTKLPITKDQIVTSLDGYSLGACPYGTSTFSGATITYTG